MRRVFGRAFALVCALVAIALVAWPRGALAGGEGEQRPLTREPDRVYTVVAGDADASAVVQNPGNLGFLEGMSFVLDVAANRADSGRRGNGVGAFFALPLPWKILAVGLGVQGMWRNSPQNAAATDLDIYNPDAPYGSFDFAIALPLQRWVRGVSIGFNYSRLFSGQNFLAADANIVDLGLSWRPNRFFALGVVGRTLNAPRLGTRDIVGNDSTPNLPRAPVEIDPEVALRPFGNGSLELAVGVRIAPVVGANDPLDPFILQPRGRLLAGADGVRLFAEAERVSYLGLGVTEPVDAVRVVGGLQFDTPHFGIAGGLDMGAGTTLEEGDGIQGGVGRIRISQDRYGEVLRVRPRRVTRFSLSRYRGERGMARLVREIDGLADARAHAILLETRGMGIGYAQVEEVREAVLRFRSRGGQVGVYMYGGGLKSYFLAASADRIIAHPRSALSITGMSMRTFYWGELIERLGAKAEFVRIAEYKGTPEVYSQKSASEPVAKQRTMLLDDKWNHVLRLVARDRGRQPDVVASWIDEAPHRAEDARRLGIVDAIAWPDELDRELESWLGRKVRIERPPTSPEHQDAWGDGPHVAVLYVEGDLVTGPSATIPLLGRKLAGSRTITKEIAKLRKDPEVRAVVVRINSRGGSVTSAEAITRELELTRDEKPVVISMGPAAASGGYYVATGGHYIFTDATTTTGSIGIFHPKVDLSGFLEKLNIGVDISSRGANATLRSWWKPYSEDEREAAMEDIQRSYDIFVERVADARSLTPEQVDEVARGRVWTGVRAIEVGLADQYGGLREAVWRAQRMAGMRPDPDAVHDYPAPPGLIDRIRALFGLELPFPLRASSEETLMGVSPAHPILRVLAELPAPLWMADAPEAMALELEPSFVE